MKPLTCAAARRRLNAFHDGELAVSDQIAVASHLEWCGGCATAAAEIRAVGAALRESAHRRVSLSNEEATAFATAVVSRIKAERDSSLLTRVTVMFTDMRLVYAGLAGTVATLVCAVVMLTMLRLATDDRPDPAALTAAFLPAPGASPNLVAIDGEVRMRWTARVRQANEAAEQDAVFALSAIVTREGRVPTLQHLRRGRRAAVDHAKRIEGLLDALERARFEPALAEGSRPSSMVWLITSTTVRATKTQALDSPLPAPKKHAASDRLQLSRA